MSINKKVTLSPGEMTIINEFVALKAKFTPGLKVNEWPDKCNSSTRDIDAIAGEYAIEHTSIDTLEYGRKNNAYFLDIIPDEQEFDYITDYWAQISISWDEIFEVKNRTETKSKLTEFLKSNLDKLDFGHTTLSNHEFPFRIYVGKHEGDSKGVYFARTVEDNNNNNLAMRVREKVLDKADKLKQYKDSGKRTIIIIESEDTALMTKHRLGSAVAEGFSNLKLPNHLDEIWFAHILEPGKIEFTNINELMVNNLNHGASF